MANEAAKLADELRGAIARGWCSAMNCGKVLDPMLVHSIFEEVMKLPALRTASAGLCYPFSTQTCDDPKCHCRTDKAHDAAVKEAVDAREQVHGAAYARMWDKVHGAEARAEKAEAEVKRLADPGWIADAGYADSPILMQAFRRHVKGGGA